VDERVGELVGPVGGGEEGGKAAGPWVIGGWGELRGIQFDAIEGGSVLGEEAGVDGGEAWVGEVLDGGEESAGGGPCAGDQIEAVAFAGFEADAAPALLFDDGKDGRFHEAFVDEDGFAGGDAVPVEGVGADVAAGGLFEVGEGFVGRGAEGLKGVEVGGDRLGVWVAFVAVRAEAGVGDA
jgi:hypothetical protein